MFLRRRNVPCWSWPVRPRLTAMNTNARASRISFWSSSRVAIVDAVSPGCTTNSTCAGSVDAARVIRTPMSSSTMPLTNGIESAAGLSAAHERIALLTRGRSAVSATTSTIPPRTSAKIANLRIPPMPPPPDPRPPRPPRRTGSEYGGMMSVA